VEPTVHLYNSVGLTVSFLGAIVHITGNTNITFICTTTSVHQFTWFDHNWHWQSSIIHINPSTTSFSTARSFHHLALNQKIESTSPKCTPRVWRMRLQRGGP